MTSSQYDALINKREACARAYVKANPAPVATTAPVIHQPSADALAQAQQLQGQADALLAQSQAACVQYQSNLPMWDANVGQTQGANARSSVAH